MQLSYLKLNNQSSILFFPSTISRIDLHLVPTEPVSHFCMCIGPCQNGNFRGKLDEFSCSVQRSILRRPLYK